MNKEQQYRTGRMAEVDPIPAWVQEKVAKIVTKRDNAFDVMGAARTVMTAMTSERGRVNAARTLLGISAETPVDGLLALTQARVNADPAHEAEYWEAMWTVREPAQATAEYRRLLRPLARALEIRQQFREAGWPEAWHHKFCELWRDLKGTPESARAWDRAGWSPEAALTERAMVHGRNASVDLRITLLHPPQYVPTMRSNVCLHRGAYVLNASSRGNS